GWRLLQAGAEVTILDRGQPGGGATWAAAGMLAVTAELEDAVQAERDLAVQSNELWPAFAADLEQASGVAVGFVRCGTLLLAEDAAALEVMRARGPVVDATGAREIVPVLADDLPGGLWVADEAQADSRALGEALTIAFLKAGGTLLPNEAVVTVEQKGGAAVALLTPYGRYHADAFVIAAGAWARQLDIPVVPVKGEMIALSPPPGAAIPKPMIWGNGVYLVPRPHRLLVGATMQEAGFDTALTAQAREHLRTRAERLIPSLRQWSLAEHWAGLRPKSPDGLPLLGPAASRNLFVAGGQFRNGILFAPAIAQMMADLVLGKGLVIPEFDPRRFG
ncbi:MAG TPA: glycine oxidase ThiO, partial [Rhizomicrobium sp.]|nr:glycine oxidase ThiO [Rhizomicrobium sp.]